MPSYPRNLRGRSQAKPAIPSPAPVRRPNIPRPANDNPRWRLPKPANDNPTLPTRPRPPRPFGLRAFRPLRYNPYRFASGLLDYGYRRWFHPAFDAPPTLGATWKIRHGPNVYPYPYQVAPQGWATGYVRDADPVGPQTGLIVGQAAYRLENLRTLQYLLTKSPSINRWSAGISRVTDDVRGANAMTIVRSTSAFYNALPPARNFLVPIPVPIPPILPVPRSPLVLPPWRQPPMHQVAPVAVPSPRSPIYPEPYPVPTRRPAIRPARQPRPEYWPEGLPVPEFEPYNPPWPDFDFPPVEIPNSRSWETTVHPSRSPRPRVSNGRGPRFHRREPPRPRERETKGKVAPVLWGLLNGFGIATEGMDLIDAAWNALPRDARSRSFYRGQYVRPAASTRAGDVLRNWDQIDLDRFARNFLANQMEDAYYGVSSGIWNPTRGRPMPNNDTRREIEENSPVGDAPIDFDEVVDVIWGAVGQGR